MRLTTVLAIAAGIWWLRKEAQVQYEEAQRPLGLEVLWTPEMVAQVLEHLDDQEEGDFRVEDVVAQMDSMDDEEGLDLVNWFMDPCYNSEDAAEN